MTKEAALYNFWSMFGLPAYEENAVPIGEDGAEFPYITYQVVTDSFGNDVALTGSVWYKSTSWKEANAKAQEISDKISHGGVTLACDGGIIWIRRGIPFAQSMGDDSDDLIKRKYINITAEFMTAD
jgi:hypothetical protein